MPSIVHESVGMAARGLALIEQQAQEQIDGLVVASLTFTALASRQRQLRDVFSYDAPPPIWPSAVSPEAVQDGRLLLGDASFEVSSGLLYISATYYGALYRAQRSPFVSYDYESRVQSIRILSGYVVTGGTSFDGFVSGRSVQAVYDNFTIQYVVEVPTANYTVLDDAKVSAPTFNAQLVRADFVVRDLQEASVQPTTEHRNLSALELLKQVAAPSPETEINVQQKTRRVATRSIRSDLIFNE